MSWGRACFEMTLNDGRQVEGIAKGRILPPENSSSEEIDHFEIDAWVYGSDADEVGKVWYLAELTDEQRQAIEDRALEALGREDD